MDTLNNLRMEDITEMSVREVLSRVRNTATTIVVSMYGQYTLYVSNLATELSLIGNFINEHGDEMRNSAPDQLDTVLTSYDRVSVLLRMANTRLGILRWYSVDNHTARRMSQAGSN